MPLSCIFAMHQRCYATILHLCYATILHLCLSCVHADFVLWGGGKRDPSLDWIRDPCRRRALLWQRSNQWGVPYRNAREGAHQISLVPETSANTHQQMSKTSRNSNSQSKDKQQSKPSDSAGTDCLYTHCLCTDCLYTDCLYTHTPQTASAQTASTQTASAQTASTTPCLERSAQTAITKRKQNTKQHHTRQAHGIP